jgi:hypothetical protein
MRAAPHLWVHHQIKNGLKSHLVFNINNINISFNM